jgi:hypothetical protein
LGFEELNHKCIHIFAYPSHPVQLSRFAALLVEYIQYQNVKLMLVGSQNHEAKGNHSVFQPQRAQSQRDPGKIRVDVWARSPRSINSKQVAQTLSGRKN